MLLEIPTLGKWLVLYLMVTFAILATEGRLTITACAEERIIYISGNPFRNSS